MHSSLTMEVATVTKSNLFILSLCKDMLSGFTPSALRPGNPTPAHATGQGSPAALRPTNPTPAHGLKHVPDRPGNSNFPHLTIFTLE